MSEAVEVFGTLGWRQVEADAHNPDLTSEERIERSRALNESIKAHNYKEFE